MAGNNLSEAQKDKLGAAAVALDQQTILTIQKVFVSKIASFVDDKNADYKILKEAAR